jgi:hypothetical protein
MKKIILSMALLAAGLTCSYATDVKDLTKDALINNSSYTVTGTFGAYDFAPKGDKDKFDWAFTTTGGDIYQLRGNAPDDKNVFGWAKAPAGTPAPEPAWYMFQVDVDGDGMGKFDWVLLSANGNAVYKLDGVAADGGFAYAGPIDIDYKVNGNSITTGAKGTLDAPTPPAEDCSNGCSSINANNIAGYTVFIEDTNNIGVDIREYIYIFGANNTVEVVLNRKDGGQTVYEGTYAIKGVAGFKVIDILVVHDNSSSSGYTVLLDDNLNVKEDQLGHTVTKILPNAKNGVEIKENVLVDGALTVTTVDDILGHTITTNVAHPGSSGMTMHLSIEFHCDNTFDYTIDIGYGGRNTIRNYHGDELYIDNHFDTARIAWHYIDDDGERSGDSLDTDVNNQVVEGSCWSMTNNDGTCSNNLKIQSVTGSGCH